MFNFYSFDISIDNILTFVSIVCSTMLSILLIYITNKQHKEINTLQNLQYQQNITFIILESRILPLYNNLVIAVEELCSAIERRHYLSFTKDECKKLGKCINSMGKNFNNIYISLSNKKIDDRYININKQFVELVLQYENKKLDKECIISLQEYLMSIEFYYENMLQFFYSLNSPIGIYLDEKKYWSPLLSKYENVRDELKK